VINPATISSTIRGDGRKGWFGWPGDAWQEALYTFSLSTTDPAKHTRLETACQRRAYAVLPFIPLRRYPRTSDWRNDRKGILKGPSVVFWNIGKT
jgi:peptide/nickel transport system substrate-binding protein